MHKNPVMSMCVAKVLIEFYRFGMLKEPFPEFPHPKKYWNIPTLRINAYRNQSVMHELSCDKHVLLHEIIDYCSNLGKTHA